MAEAVRGARPPDRTPGRLLPDAGPPLVALLHRCERAFVTEFDRRIAATEFRSLSLAHSRNVLRHLGAGPVRASEIVQMCDVSKQALSRQIMHLEQAGYLRVDPDPHDQRARLLVLTDRGGRAQRLVKEIFAEIESDWVATLGDPDGPQLRPLLTRLLQAVEPRAAAPGSC